MLYGLYYINLSENEISLTLGKYDRLNFFRKPLWQITNSPCGIVFVLRNYFCWLNVTLAEQTLPVIMVTIVLASRAVKTHAVFALDEQTEYTKLYINVIIEMADKLWLPFWRTEKKSISAKFTSLWSTLAKSTPFTSTIWSPTYIMG